MGEAKFTRGPWTLHDMEAFTVVTAEKPGKFIALCDSRHLPVQESQANTVLCAAAPELYEALNAYELMADAPSAIEDMARAALRKARGESNG